MFVRFSDHVGEKDHEVTNGRGRLWERSEQLKMTVWKREGKDV